MAYEGTLEMELPSGITIQERNEYGYFSDEMLPLDQDAAIRLGIRGFSVFRLYSDNTESELSELSEIRDHDGLFGVETEKWKSFQKELEEKERDLLTGTEDRFGIYQFKHSEKTRVYHFMDLEYLHSQNYQVNKEDYNLEYTDVMGEKDTPSTIFQRFNLNRPLDFYGHSLSVSDVVVFHRDGENRAFFVDGFGFQEVPEFFFEERTLIRDEPDQMAYQIGEYHIAIQLVDDGYDYTIFDKNYKEVDGGVYTDTRYTISYVAVTVMEDMGFSMEDPESNKKILVTNGMSNDMVLVETDAPELVIMQWIFQNKLAELDGTGWENEIPGYVMNVLYDSELDNGKDVDEIGYDEVYDFNHFGEEDYESLIEKADEVNAIPIQTDIIQEFREKTKEQFKEVGGINAADAEAVAIAYVASMVEDYDLDVTIRDAVVYGSRSRGMEHENSDVDVVLEYSSEEIREDNLFNLLHEDGFLIGGQTLDINPIRAEETGTLETYLPKAEHFLKEKQKEIEEKSKAHIDFYTAECMEFTSLGVYEEFSNLEDAIQMYKEIPEERIRGIKGIGFVYHLEGDLFDGAVCEVFAANHIDYDMFNKISAFGKSEEARNALLKLYETFPDAEILNFDVVKELAEQLDTFAYEIDPYSYKDEVQDRRDSIQNIANDIRMGNTSSIKEFLQGVINEDPLEEDMKAAEQLLKRLDDPFVRKEKNPLTKVEELEEENFDMIDGTLNNLKEEPDVSKMSIKERMKYMKERSEPKAVKDTKEMSIGGKKHETLE